MKTNLDFYFLETCEKCTRIKYALIAEDIEHELVNCTSSSNSICDKLEDKVDCGRYPMAVVKNKGVTTIIHFCDKKPTASATTKKVPVDSEEKFIQEVKKAYI
jgi:hypothetical protein